MTENQKKKHLHTTISHDTYEMIETLAKKYGTKQGVIEEAVRQLQVKDHHLDKIKKKELDVHQLWHLMRDDFNMMAVGRRTFLSYISKIPQEPIKNNNAIELVEWYYNNTQIDNLNLYQILFAIKKIWLSGNYFRKCEIKIPNDIEPYKCQDFQMNFTHDFDSKDYGQYWSQYFKYVMEQPLIGANVDVQNRHHCFYLQIKKD